MNEEIVQVEEQISTGEEMTLEDIRKQRLKAIIGILGYIALYLVASSIILSIIVFVIADNPTEIEDIFKFIIDVTKVNDFLETVVKKTYLAMSLSNLITYVFLFLFLVIIYLKELHKDMKEIFRNFASILQLLFLSILIFFGMNILVNLLMELLLSLGLVQESSANQQQIEDMVKYGYGAYIFIAAVFLGPLVEEIIFRKAIFDLIKKPYVALIVSSLIFGFIHIITTEGNLLNKVLQGIPYIASGGLFGYFYLKSKRNILFVYLVHMLTNLLGMIAIFTQL